MYVSSSLCRLLLPPLTRSNIDIDCPLQNFPANPTRRTRSVQLTSVNECNANVADTPPVVYTNRWPAGVITGLLLGAMTLFFLIIGFLATMDVQSPERFESSEKKQRSSS